MSKAGNAKPDVHASVAELQAPFPGGHQPGKWAADHAEALDAGLSSVDVLAQFGSDGLLGLGIPENLGGAGGSITDAVDAVASLAGFSLTAAFMYWGHRCYTEYVLHSDNPTLRAHWLPELLAGRRAGATGMSNAMKFLGGLEPLQVQASAGDRTSWLIHGRLPWVTHLRPGNFSVAAAVQPQHSGDPVPVFAFHHDQAGVQRSADLPLIAMRGSQTAAIELSNVKANIDQRLHADLKAWLPIIRPPFLALQCGMALGLAYASLEAACAHAGEARQVLAPRLGALRQELEHHRTSLYKGLQEKHFQTNAAALFRLRIALASNVQQATTLELQASGGRAYLSTQCLGFSRRWREAAFIPVITPSLTQLEAQLERQPPSS